MRGKASRKIEEGKLVRVELEYDNVIIDAKISGDFFIQPPEALESLERVLEGMGTDIDKESVVEKLEEVDARLIGFSREDVADCVLEVVR